MATNAVRSLAAVYAVPVLLFVVGAAGLAIALTGDGMSDLAGWIALGSLVACAAWFALRR